MAITIRLLNKEEIELANNFFNRIYKSRRSLDDFQWEFLNGPFGTALYVIALDDTITTHPHVVGIQCAIPIELTDAKGNITRTAKSEDTLVDPDYRGQKIFERMYEFLFDECKKNAIACIWGFTPAKKAFERIGFEIPFQAQQALMVFKPLSAYSYLAQLNPQNKFLDKLKIVGLSMLSYASSMRARFISHHPVEEKQIDIQSKIQVINKTMINSNLHFLNMNEAYMNWRIKENPFHNRYENYQFFQHDILIADAIINFRKVGYIEQLIFSDGASIEIKKSVVGHLVQKMKTKADSIRILCFDSNEELKEQEELFKQCGFIVLKRGGHFVWKEILPTAVTPVNLFITRLFTQGNV